MGITLFKTEKQKKQILISLFVLIIALAGLLAIVNQFILKADTVNQNYFTQDQIGVYGLMNKKQADELGVEWTRHPLKWEDYETNKVLFDQYFEQTKGMKMKVILTVRSVHSLKTNCPSWAPKRELSCPPKDIKEYKAFIREIVQKYKSVVAAWQFENEPFSGASHFWAEAKLGQIDSLIELTKTASEIVREEDPGKIILSPSLAFGGKITFDDQLNPDFSNTSALITRAWKEAIDPNFRRFTKENCGYFDAVDVHLYHTVDSIKNRVKWVNNALSASNCNGKELWTTETAGPQLDNISQADNTFYQEQADEIPLRFKALYDAGIKRAIYFHYRDNIKEGGDIIFATLGLKDVNNTNKPAFLAFKNYVAGLSTVTTTAILPPSTPSIPPTHPVTTITTRSVTTTTTRPIITTTTTKPVTTTTTRPVTTTTIVPATTTQAPTVLTAPNVGNHKSYYYLPANTNFTLSTTIDFKAGWNMLSFGYIPTREALPTLSPYSGIFTSIPLNFRVAYKYISALNNYQDILSENSILPFGNAVWVYSQTNRTAKATDNVSKIQSLNTIQADAIEIPLNSNPYPWTMVGNPYIKDIPFDDSHIFIKLSNGQMTKISDALNSGIVAKSWAFDSTTNNYQELVPNTSILLIHQGFWIKTNQTGAKLLISPVVVNPS